MNTKTRVLNRIKLALVENGNSGVWLAKQLEKDAVTVSKWCTNTTQPDLYTLEKISKLLNTPIRDQLLKTSNMHISDFSPTIKIIPFSCGNRIEFALS